MCSENYDSLFSFYRLTWKWYVHRMKVECEINMRVQFCFNCLSVPLLNKREINVLTSHDRARTTDTKSIKCVPSERD